MGDTKIEWTRADDGTLGATWNPVTGCSRVSPGCEHCYAEALSLRQGWSKFPWTANHAKENVVLHPKRLNQPLSWRQPKRVFVNSMSDLFHELVPDEFLDQVFAVMALASKHTFLLLTKRPERMQAYMATPNRGAMVGLQVMEIWLESKRRGAINPAGEALYWPPDNVWLGVSVEDQRRADERIPLLLQTPAATRFLSCEPLLGHIEFLGSAFGCPECGDQSGVEGEQCLACGDGEYMRWPGIDWVIVGGESGPAARPMDLEWARSLVQQCQAADVPVFMKQLGARPRWDRDETTIYLRDRKGGDPSEWPSDLRVRQFPSPVAVL